MKHVFIINAHTPYLTSLGIMNERNIEDKDVVFVLGRNYKCVNLSGNIQTYDFSELYDYRLNLLNRRKVLKRLEQVKVLIGLNIREDYILYLPHLNYCFFQAFAQHPRCKEIKFIEEGIVDFCKDETLEEKISIKKKIINNLYFKGTDYWVSNRWNTYIKLGKRRVNETFAITDKLYGNIPCRHTVIRWPYMALNYSIDENATFFVFDSLVEQKIVDLELYLDVCKKTIEKYKNTMNYIKFHPYQQEIVKNRILMIFQNNGLKAEALPNEIPFEMILCNKKHLKVCGFTTSLVFYASLLGHEAHIYIRDFFKSPSFCSYWNRFEKSLKIYGDVFKFEK